METCDFTEGETAFQDFELARFDVLTNEWVVLDATAGGLLPTGMSVELVLRKADGTLVDTSTNVNWIDPASGYVRYRPDAGDLLAADTPHQARWKVTDANGRVEFFPKGRADRWVVRK